MNADAAPAVLALGAEILPVTDEDVLAAHAAIFARPKGLEHIPIAAPTNDEEGREWCAALKRALETDRRRVAGQQ